MNDLTKQLADALEAAKSDFYTGMDKIVRQYEDRGNGSWAGADDNFLHLKASADKIDTALLAFRAQGEAKYRMLEEGELIQEGDQFFDADGQWRHASGIRPNEVYKRSYKLHRRPITEGRV